MLSDGSIILSQTHTPSTAYTTDGTSHWKTCTVCNAKLPDTEETHTESTTYTTDDSSHWKTCTVCNAKLSATEETHTKIYCYDTQYHWQECECGHSFIADKEEHSIDEDDWKYDESCHWHECEVCKYIPAQSKTAHASEKKATCTEDEVCKECGAIMNKATGHLHTYVAYAKEPTYTEEGYSGDTYCKDCGKKIETGKTLPRKTLPYKGTVIKDNASNGQYSITDSVMLEVKLIKPIKASKTSFKVPSTISYKGLNYKVTEVSSKAFYKNSKLQTVKIGTNVKTIGKSAFEGCKKLKTITIGKNVTKIADKAFEGCKAVTALTIPSKVTKIGKSAFEGCLKLKKITIKTKSLKSANVGAKAFSKLPAKAVIKVPKSVYTKYKGFLVKKGFKGNNQKIVKY